MRNILILLFCVLAFSAKANAAVNVFACEPEWAALAKEIGGDNVSVFSATRGTQDPHHVSAKPSLLAAMRKTDLVICTGAGLEAGWLPVLMQSAPASVQPGAKGHLLASDHLALTGKPAVVDRALGDVHPEGNPHVQTDPRNIAIVAKAVAERLSAIDTANAAQYQANLNSFTANWQSLVSKWSNDAAALKGTSVVTYHESWAYLLRWLGMEQVATLEVKPGVPPTASHLQDVLQTAKSSNAKLILLSPFDNDQAAKWLSSQTGAKVVRLPFTVGGLPGTDTLLSVFDKTIATLKG